MENLIIKNSIQFFGKITASISHEAKNALAIINENNGLIDDLIIFAEKKGEVLPAEKIKTISNKITKQIERANIIFKNLNKFAHSSDNEISNENIDDIIELIIIVSTRLANIKGAKLIHKKTTNPININTYTFILEAIIFLTIFDMVNSNSQDIEISAEKKENTILINLVSNQSLNLKEFPSEDEKALVSYLKAKLNLESNKIIITLPLTI